MAQRHDGMVDVELDDEPGPPSRHGPELAATGAQHPGHIAPATGTSLRRDRARLLRAAAVAVVVCAVVIASLSLREEAAVRADDALVAAAARTPGLVPSLRTPLHERWRAGAGSTVVGGVVLRAEESGGSVRTVARELASGDRLWVMQRSLTPGNLTPRCRLLGGPREGLVCEVPGRPGIQAANTDEALGSTPGFLAVLDARTGATVEVAVLEVGTVGWDVVDGDLVTGRLSGTDLMLERVDPEARLVRWSRQVPLPDGVLARQLTLRVTEGFVLVDGVSGIVLDAARGTLLGSFTGSDGGAVGLSASILGFTVWDGTTGSWHDAQGRTGAVLTGSPFELGIDDGSGGALELLRYGPSIMGVEVIDVGLAWNRGPVERALLRLDGRLLLDEGELLRAVDAGSGANLWSVAGSLGSPQAQAASDGLRVLAVVPGAGSERPRLTALDLADGSVVWSTPMPEGTTSVSAEDGTVVAVGQDVVVVLG